MPLESNSEIEIKRSNLKNFEGFHYELLLSGTDTTFGSIDLQLTTVDFCKGDTRYRPLIESGLGPGDKIANITYIEPDEKFFEKLAGAPLKKGSGSKMLDKLIWDAAEYGCKAMIALTGREIMKDFLKRHGFRSSDKYEQEYYRLLIKSDI